MFNNRKTCPAIARYVLRSRDMCCTHKTCAAITLSWDQMTCEHRQGPAITGHGLRSKTMSCDNKTYLNIFIEMIFQSGKPCLHFTLTPLIFCIAQCVADAKEGVIREGSHGRARSIARSMLARSMARSHDRSLNRSLDSSLDRSLVRPVARWFDRSSTTHSIARSIARSTVGRDPRLHRLSNEGKTYAAIADPVFTGNVL